MKIISLLIIACIIANCSGKPTSSKAQSKPIVIAHRGASGYLPEHTLQAKTAAFIMGSDYIEQDLVLTKDNVPIVLHDIYLDEVTDVSKKFPDRYNPTDKRYYAIDFTLDEIKTLGVSERFLDLVNMTNPRFPNRFPLWKSEFRLNTFKDEIELIQGLQKSMNGKKIGIYVEIKQPYFHRQHGKNDFSEIVLKILSDNNYTKADDLAIIQCFDPFELLKIRNDLKSELTLVQLLETGTPSEPYINSTFWSSEEGLKNISSFAQGIGPEAKMLIVLENNKFVRASDMANNAKNLNLFIHPWTFRFDSLPNYVDSYDALLDIYLNKVHVDGLFTDFPDKTITFINNKSTKTRSTTITLLMMIIYLLFIIF